MVDEGVMVMVVVVMEGEGVKVIVGDVIVMEEEVVIADAILIAK